MKQWIAFWEGGTTGIISGANGVRYAKKQDAITFNPGADGYARIQIDDGVLTIIYQEKAK